MAITAQIGFGSAVLTPQGDGALERDSGTFGPVAETIFWTSAPYRTLIRDGQKVLFYTAVWIFTGEHGTLTFRERNEWHDLGNDADGDGTNDGVAVGTWKVLLGTGDYAGVRGGGRSAHEGLGRRWNARYEGFLTLP